MERVGPKAGSVPPPLHLIEGVPPLLPPTGASKPVSINDFTTVVRHNVLITPNQIPSGTKMVQYKI